MFVSKRFTSRLTKQTHERLLQAFDNSRPLARRERSRGAVVALQAAISDLNQGYLASADVDGFFGRGTAAAVEAFQRDYGLYADGIAGRQTLQQLDEIFSSDLFREPQGMSIHIGVNEVDAAHYGEKFELEACVNDANDFRDTARKLGYNDITLVNSEATTGNFTAALRQAATNLFSGDSLFVTFSGHGSQLTNTSPDAEADGMDETLCFFDRMLLDDEVYCLLGDLRPGVNVTLVYDSCHSATVTRDALDSDRESVDEASFRAMNERAMRRRIDSFDPDATDDAIDDAGAEARFVPFKTDQLMKALDGDRAEQVERTTAEHTVNETVDLLVEIGTTRRTAKPRFINRADVLRTNGIYDRNKELYEAVKSLVGTQEGGDLECHVVALSACQDNQTTLDGTVNGLYSGNVLAQWTNGGFKGSIGQLHKNLRSESPATITPALTTYGGPRADARLYERPFAI